MSKIINYDGIKDFCTEIVKRYETSKSTDDLNSVGIVAKYDIMRDIFADLVQYGYTIRFAELEDSDIDHYDGEFILALFDNEIWLEKAMLNQGETYVYRNLENGSMFISSECNPCIHSHVESNNTEIFDIIDKYVEREYHTLVDNSDNFPMYTGTISVGSESCFKTVTISQDIPLSKNDIIKILDNFSF